MTHVNSKVLAILVFGFFLLLNVASSGGHIDGSIGPEYFLVTESMALKHSAKMYPDVPSVDKLHAPIRDIVIVNSYLQTGTAYVGSALKPLYIENCCLLSAIGVPFYYLASFLSVSPIIGVSFLNALILSLISVVIFCFSLEIYGSKKIAFILSVIFAVSSFAWPYNNSLLPQPLQALLLIASAFFIYISVRKVNRGPCDTSNINHKGLYFAGLGGLFLGFSIFAHPSSLIAIPGFIVYSIFSMRSSRNMLVVFLVVFAIISLFAGLVNYWRFGSFTDFGYGLFGGLAVHGGWTGLIGLLASPGFGLIFYFPIMILLPIAFKFMYKQNKKFFLLSAYVIIVFWLYFGTISWPPTDPGTWNGLVWGPRYLVPILPFVTTVFGALLLHLKNRLFLRFATITLCVSGFYINLLGSLEWYWYGYGYAWSELGLSKFESDSKVRGVNSMDVVTWDPIYSPIILHMKLLSSDWIFKSGAKPEFRGPGLAPCLYDNYIFCKFGILPTLLLLAVVAVLGILILTEIISFKPESLFVYLRNLGGAKRDN